MKQKSQTQIQIPRETLSWVHFESSIHSNNLLPGRSDQVVKHGFWEPPLYSCGLWGNLYKILSNLPGMRWLFHKCNFSEVRDVGRGQYINGHVKDYLYLIVSNNENNAFHSLWHRVEDNDTCCYFCVKCSAMFLSSPVACWFLGYWDFMTRSSEPWTAPETLNCNRCCQPLARVFMQMNCPLSPTPCPHDLGLSWALQPGLTKPESTMPQNSTFWNTGHPPPLESETFHLSSLSFSFILLPTNSCQQDPSMPCSQQCQSYLIVEKYF